MNVETVKSIVPAERHVLLTQVVKGRLEGKALGLLQATDISLDNILSTLKKHFKWERGYTCPAHIKLVERDDGSACISYQKVHLGRLNLSKQDRTVLAGKILVSYI